MAPETALGHFTVLVMSEDSNNKLLQQGQFGGKEFGRSKLKKEKIIVITETIYIVLLSVGEERVGGGKLSDLKISKVCLFVCVFLKIALE